MTKKTERMNQIIDLLKIKNGASTKELATHFQVSEMTIRRDVSILCAKGIVSNLYGAVVIHPDNNILTNSYHLGSALSSHHLEKDKLGQFAATLIAPDDILIIDTGSTTEFVAKHISSSLSLTVLCYNYNVLSHLISKPDIKLIFSGGGYHPNTQMFESREGRAMIRNIRATKVFVSAAGIHESMGVTCANGYEVDTKQAILQSGYERILVADSSKFSVIQSRYFADLNQFHVIITDSGIPPQWVSLIKELGITLHIVP